MSVNDLVNFDDEEESTSKTGFVQYTATEVVGFPLPLESLVSETSVGQLRMFDQLGGI